jgi:hypothetical protein
MKRFDGIHGPIKTFNGPLNHTEETPLPHSIGNDAKKLYRLATPIPYRGWVYLKSRFQLSKAILLRLIFTRTRSEKGANTERKSKPVNVKVNK